MRDVHGYVPDRAVCGRHSRCYTGVMKPQPHRNAGAHPDAGRSPTGTRFVSEREVNPANLRSPPVVPHRRYPSLSDDGLPYFPRLQPKTRRREESVTVTRVAVQKDQPIFSSVRAIAVLAIVAIIAVLVAAA